MAVDLADMRKPYRGRGDTFDVDSLVAKEPFAQFEDWFQKAKSHPEIEEPNAMCLATATKVGVPSARFVLLKSYGFPNTEDLKLDPKAEPGFVFFTNYASRKGLELKENPLASLVFYWGPLNRSVRVEGTVSRTSEALSDAYFDRRPFASQIGARLEIQSRVIASRDFLERKDAEATKQFEGKTVPRPDCWGGYRVVPNCIEFWQGQSTRIHDRLRFRKPKQGEALEDESSFVLGGDDGWIVERLSP